MKVVDVFQPTGKSECLFPEEINIDKKSNTLLFNLQRQNVFFLSNSGKKFMNFALGIFNEKIQAVPFDLDFCIGTENKMSSIVNINYFCMFYYKSTMYVLIA